MGITFSRREDDLESASSGDAGNILPCNYTVHSPLLIRLCRAIQISKDQ